MSAHEISTSASSSSPPASRATVIDLDAEEESAGSRRRDPKRLVIASWNVAGWMKTLAKLRSHKMTLSEWLDRHGIDVLCLQEVKSTDAVLRGAPQDFGAREADWDAFFSLERSTQSAGNYTFTNGGSSISAVFGAPTDSGEGGAAGIAARLARGTSVWNPQSKGMNGVATFARKGLTSAALRDSLDSKNLNEQGRCLETHHGDGLAVFNVYAPNDGGGYSLSNKMLFFLALERRMRLVAQTKSVCLVGDLNAYCRWRDVHAANRVVRLDRLLSAPARAEDPGIVARLRASLGPQSIKPLVVDGESFSDGISALLASLKKARVVLDAEGAGPPRYRCKVPSAVAGTWRELMSSASRGLKEEIDAGALHMDAQVLVDCTAPRNESLEWFEEEIQALVAWARAARDGDDVWRPREASLPNEGSRVAGAWVAKVAFRFTLEFLQQCMYAVFGWEKSWRPKDVSELCAAPGAADFLAVRSGDATALWLRRLLSGREDSGLTLVDSFLAFHAHCAERFTVWDQYRNGRFVNHGARLDFALTDARLRLVPPDAALPGCGCARQGARCVPPSFPCEASESAAANAATAFGVWRPAPMEGGGIPETTTSAFAKQFPDGPAQTGIVYTPPDLSDHVPVTCVLDVSEMEDLVGCSVQIDAAHEKSTKDCRSYAAQTSIKSFFGKASASPPAQPPPVAAKRPPEKRVGPLLSMFEKKHRSKQD